MKREVGEGEGGAGEDDRSPRQSGLIGRAFGELVGTSIAALPALKKGAQPSEEVDLFRLRQNLHRTVREVLLLLTLLEVARTPEARAGYVRRIRALLASFPWEHLDEREPPEIWLRPAGSERGQEEPSEAAREALREHATEIIARHWPSLWSLAADFAYHTLRRNLLTLLGMLFFAAVVVFVEPVGALYAEEPGTNLGIAAAVLFGPFLLNLLVARLGARSRHALARDAAAHLSASYRISFDHRLRREEGWRLPERLRLDVPILLLGVSLRVAIRLGVAILAGLLLYHAGDEEVPTRTVGVSICMASAAISLLHATDFYGWLFPFRRRSVLLVLNVLAVSYALWQSPTGWSLVALSGALTLGSSAYLVAGLLPLRARASAPPGEERPRLNGPTFFVQRVLPFAIALTGLLALLSLRFTRARERWSDEGLSRPRPTVPAEAWPRDLGRPIVVVAAAGGGSRAAYYAARTFAMIDRQQVRGPGLERGHRLRADLQAVSAVSGGSLATAAYLSWRLRFPAEREAGRGRAHLLRVVRCNFMWPVLRGSLFPAQSRGQSVERGFGEAFGTDARLGELAERWVASPGAVPFPMPIFNATDLRGPRVTLSPLRWEAYADERSREAIDPRTNAYERQRRAGIEEPAWVYYRTGSYGLEHLLRRYDPRLPELVRASANFPFGFPPIDIETEQPLFLSPDAEDRRAGVRREVHLTDGGVRHNSGVWPLFDLLMRRADVLRELGVVLVIVDAGKMPQPRSGLLSAVLDQHPLGREIHRLMIAALRERYRGRLGVVEIDLPPDRRHNVYTSWALDRDARAYIERAFNEGEPGWSEELSAIYQLLQGALHTPGGAPPEDLEARMREVDRLEERLPTD